MPFDHETLTEFEDEEKWFYIFNKKSFLAFLVCFGVGIIFAKLSSFLFVTAIPGIIVGALLALLSYAIFTFKLPADDYIKMCGLPLDKYLINRLCRKLYAVIYVLGYNNDEGV